MQTNIYIYIYIYIPRPLFWSQDLDIGDSNIRLSYDDRVFQYEPITKECKEMCDYEAQGDKMEEP